MTWPDRPADHLADHLADLADLADHLAGPGRMTWPDPCRPDDLAGPDDLADRMTWPTG